MQSCLCLSFKTRTKLYVVLKTATVLFTVLSVVYLGIASYSLHRHRFLLHVLIISLFDDLYNNIIALGVLLFLLSIVSFKLNINLKNQPTNHSLPRAQRILVGLLLLTVVATVLCDILMTKTEIVVDAQVGPRLKHGLSHYMDTPSWGSALDRVQTYLQCCGVHGPADWYSTTWIPKARVADHNIDSNFVQPNGKVQVPLVPTSCCKVVSAECGHKAWMEAKTRSWRDIKPAGVSLLHTVGCEEAIKSTVARDMYIFKIILLIVLILQVVLVVVLRLLYTSTINSLMLGRPKEKAPAWIFAPRMFGTKKRYGYLQDYDNKCQNIESGEEHEDNKNLNRRWKCLSKIRCKKSGKGAISEETESSEGRKRFRPPCLAKLRSPCIDKLKESYSRKFRSKKKKEVDYTPLEIETDAGAETEDEMKTRISDLKREKESTIKNSNKSEENGIPKRIRGKEDQQFRVQTDIKRSPFENSSILRKKISGNLIDVEDVFEPQHNLDIFRAGANSSSPFSAKTEEGKSPENQTSGGNGTTHRKTDNVRPKRHVSVVVNDFKKRRELFENAGKMNSQTDSGKVEKVQEAITSPFRTPLNLIDLDGIESAKSLSAAVTSGTDITTLSSVRYDVKTRPLLRNYPPISPLE